MKTEIFNQEGSIIKTLHPSSVVQAIIYSDEQRKMVKKLIEHGFKPHHSSVGKGKCSRKHWRIEKYIGKFGKGFKMISSSPFSNNFNHLTYFTLA